MEFKLIQKHSSDSDNDNKDRSTIYIIEGEKKVASVPGLSPEEEAFAAKSLDAGRDMVTINQYNKYVFIFNLKPKITDYQTRDACRKAGADVQSICSKFKITELAVLNMSAHGFAGTALAEGAALANYQFLKYKTDTKKQEASLATISFLKNTATEKDIAYLTAMTDAIYKVRTLVNEPLNHLSAVQLSEAFVAMGNESGFSVTVMGKDQIEQEKMGGLLSVNFGSKQPPTFTIMEYKPKKHSNKTPIVLVGKGIVYDTGGVSLKPTLNSMDRMKSDMSGAALVGGAMYAIAKLELPLHVIALVPATDNRPGEEAYVPGDVITMYSGKTVEVLNTDAEGRMVLADALHWAKRYEPELVMDFATLTGAASVAVGEHGIVCMGTADDLTKKAFRESGFRQYERLVEYPLWEEYGEQIKSDIADIKNVGGSSGGAITAGKFLEHFIEYPWMHFDIAGVSFATSKKGYTPNGGTGYGLRMLLDFLMHYGK